VHLGLEVMPQMALFWGTPDMSVAMSVSFREDNLRASLSNKTAISLHQTPPCPPLNTLELGAVYHSKAANAVRLSRAADRAEADSVAQEDGQGDESANQNRSSGASAARMPDLCAAAGKRAGATTR